jgi:hypothetical protein
VCPEQQAKIGWSRRGKAVVSKCLERKGMSEIFFCQGCGASGDLLKYKSIRKVVLANPAFETSMVSGVNSQNQFVKAMGFCFHLGQKPK